jgi:hypothetical protein
MGRRALCRRRFLAQELGDERADVARISCASACDVCAATTGACARGSDEDATAAAKTVLAALRTLDAKGKKSTCKQLVDEALKAARAAARVAKGGAASGSTAGAAPNALAALADAGRAEWLLATLFLDDVLAEDVHYTAYATIVYVRPGRHAPALDAGARMCRVMFPSGLDSSPRAAAPGAPTPAKRSKQGTAHEMNEVVVLEDSEDEAQGFDPDSFGEDKNGSAFGVSTIQFSSSGANLGDLDSEGDSDSEFE